MTADQQKRVEEIRAHVANRWIHFADMNYLLDLLREQQAERIVKVKIGAGARSRDLVWCECGRGISATGNWVHCPRCGGKIDQESYREATRAAFANGLSGHHEADLINQIAAQQSELEALRKDRERMRVTLQEIAFTVPAIQQTCDVLGVNSAEQANPIVRAMKIERQLGRRHARAWFVPGMDFAATSATEAKG